MKRFIAILMLLTLIPVLAYASHRTISHPELGFSAQWPARNPVTQETNGNATIFSYEDYPTWRKLQVIVYDIGVDELAKKGDIKSMLGRVMEANVDADTKMDASGLAWSKDDAGHLRVTATFTITAKDGSGTARWTERLVTVPETGRMYQLDMTVETKNAAEPFDNSDFFDNFKLIKN
jgi:hypothetical protein